MSKEQRVTEELASATQPTHYNVVPHDEKSVPASNGDDSEKIEHESDAHPASAQPPIETYGIEIKDTGESAGGIPAIVQTVKHAWGEMGLGRSLKTLLAVNQKDGFDCPGCAWPEPDRERSHAEFCENGAKAVAEEATTKRVTPEFFREWSVEELSQKSDYWLGKQGRLTQPMPLRRRARTLRPS